jgi:hypothetical protein
MNNVEAAPSYSISSHVPKVESKQHTCDSKGYQVFVCFISEHLFYSFGGDTIVVVLISVEIESSKRTCVHKGSVEEQ